MDEWLPEQLKTVKNLTDIAYILIDLGRLDLLPSILELLHELTQQIVLENCVKDEE